MTSDFCCSHRAKAQALIQNLSLLLVDASIGTIQCLEEIVSLLTSSFFSYQQVLMSDYCVFNNLLSPTKKDKIIRSQVSNLKWINSLVSSQKTQNTYQTMQQINN